MGMAGIQVRLTMPITTIWLSVKLLTMGVYFVLTNAEARYSTWEYDTSGTMRQGEKWRNLWFVYGEVRGDWTSQTFVFRPIVFRCMGFHPIARGCGKQWSAPASENTLHIRTTLYIQIPTEKAITIMVNALAGKFYVIKKKKIKLFFFGTKIFTGCFWINHT